MTTTFLCKVISEISHDADDNSNDENLIIVFIILVVLSIIRSI